MKILVYHEIGRPKNPFEEYQTNISGDSTWKRTDDWTDFEQSVTTYPAPGMEDGEHEAELQWQLRANRDLVEAGIEKEIRWMDANKTFAEELRLSTPEAFRQVYRLSPSLKEAEVKSPEQQLLDQPKEQVIERQFKNNCDYGFKQRNVNAFIRLAFESGFENGMNYQKYSNHPDTK